MFKIPRKGDILYFPFISETSEEETGVYPFYVTGYQNARGQTYLQGKLGEFRMVLSMKDIGKEFFYTEEQAQKRLEEKQKEKSQKPPIT